MRVVSVNFSVSPWNDWQCVVTAILKGAESAGASTESYFFSTGRPVVGQAIQAGPGDSAEPDVSFLVSRLQAADCAMLGIAGAVDLNGSLFGRFVRACLAINAPAGGPSIASRETVGAATEYACAARRALAIVQPPTETCDHDDPWSSRRFGVLEDLSGALAFAPAGRILSTGFFHPSIAQNPFLQEQAAELGRRLVASARVDGRKS